MSERSTEDLAAGVQRQVRALGARIANGRPEELRELVALLSLVDEQLGRAVRGLRDLGHNDVEIGAALGVTRSAVSHRWPGGGRYIGAGGRYRRPALFTEGSST